MNRPAFLIVALMLSFSVMAQQSRTITGTVKEASGEPLIGAYVVVKGLSISVVTNTSGGFSVTVPQGQHTLVVSYLGFATKEVPISNQTFIAVVLEEDVNALEDVVVVGYGVQRKKDLTGAVASIKSDQIRQIPVSQPAEALQGRVAGLDVTRGSGDAGADVTIRLRGNRSVSTDKDELAGYNEPLIIVDGMQGVSLSDITTNDILTFDVLKDAASTAIYGARGANGVIIVTTKSGQAGKPRLSINSYYGLSDVAGYGEYMNTAQYVDYRIEKDRAVSANAANGWTGTAKTVDQIFSADQLSKINAGNDYYWPGMALHTGFQQEHNVSLTAGNDATKVYLSASIFDEQGILKNDRFTRYTGRLNVDQTVLSWLSVGLRMQMGYSQNDKRHDPLNAARRIAPYEPPYNEDGSLVLNPGNINNNANPLLDEDPNNWQNKIDGTRFSGAAYIDIKPFKGFSLRSNFGTSLTNSTNGMFWSTTSVRALTNSTNKDAGVSQSRSDYRRFQWENVMTYNTSFADSHQLTFTGVQSIEKSMNSGMSYTSNAPAVLTQRWFLPDETAQRLDLNGSYAERSYASLAGRVNYILLNRYIVNASLRYDASSKVNGNWASFPSAGAAWRVSDEPFLSESAINNVLSNLKLRGSWGVSGNDNVDDYVSQTTLVPLSGFSWNGTQIASAYTPDGLVGNKDLTWERTSTIDLGVDMGLFNNRVNVTFDWYTAKTVNLIAEMKMPSITGVSRTYKNFGEVSNKGYELLVETYNIKTKNFGWNTALTFAQNEEEIVSLPGNKSITNYPYSRNVLIIGSPVEVAYGYIMDGIWQVNEAEEAAKYGAKPGDIKFQDLSKEDGENSISSNFDRVVLGKMAPDFYGGINNDFRYKGFDLSVFAIFRANFWVSSNFITKYDPTSDNNAPFVDYWTPENPTGTYPRPGSTYHKSQNEMAHTMTLMENSFFKIKNVTVGYTLPKRLMDQLKINKVRLWASAKNVFIWQRDPAGFDPENVNNLGELVTDHPLNKLVTFGLNVEF